MQQKEFSNFINDSYDNMIKEGMTHSEAVKEMKEILNFIMDSRA